MHVANRPAVRPAAFPVPVLLHVDVIPRSPAALTYRPGRLALPALAPASRSGILPRPLAGPGSVADPARSQRRWDRTLENGLQLRLGERERRLGTCSYAIPASRPAGTRSMARAMAQRPRRGLPRAHGGVVSRIRHRRSQSTWSHTGRSSWPENDHGDDQTDRGKPRYEYGTTISQLR